MVQWWFGIFGMLYNFDLTFCLANYKKSNLTQVLTFSSTAVSNMSQGTNHLPSINDMINDMINWSMIQ